MSIHVTTIRHTEFRKYEKPGPKQQLLDIIWQHIFFYEKRIYVAFKQEGINYCTAHKYTTETINNASGLINKSDHCYI